MEYNFNAIEKKWQETWEKHSVYKVSNESTKPKYYVLDMFPYPSGAGLHVGHPLGYIASDIVARFKRLKGFNVLHPMGYDAFGLPAEQYAIDHGIHPAISTEQNIANFRNQLDKIGFSYDWSRQVKTCDPQYYKWTQWIFLQLFHSYYNRTSQKAESIAQLTATFEKEGNQNHPCPGDTALVFDATTWTAYSAKEQQEILMHYRLAFCGYGEVNWCEALGTVLANDEVVNGVSERGGHPVEKKRLRQWYLRITEYAERLLEGLERINFSDAMKEMQTNWIGRSYGAEMEFSLTPNPSPEGEGDIESPTDIGKVSYKTAKGEYWNVLKEFSRDNRKNATEAEAILWELIRNNQLGEKARRQHAIEGYIVDFVFLQLKLVVEIDGDYHSEEEQEKYDTARTSYLSEFGFKVLRFTNEEIIDNSNQVINKIKLELETRKQTLKAPLSPGRGAGGEAKLRVYTTRPDTIFGVDFMVVAPEHDIVAEITTPEQQQAVEAYIAYVKSRSERERQAEKKISGCFTGAYCINPFNGILIPIWISEYVLAGYGTGAIMAVPCGDERDFKFAQHFNIPITNILGEAFNGNEANPTKDAVLVNSDFLNGVVMRDAINIVCEKIEALGIGKRKTNYRMRDAAFSRQRYWGEPFPIQWKDGVANPLPESELPLTLPTVETYSPGPEGEGPLANIPEWVAKELETNTMPGYAGSSWYFLRYMDPTNETAFCSRQVSDYWNQVDLYVGGTEHAVGHLLYSRLWTKILYDLGFIGFDEPFKQLLNQGMITGSSRFVYRVRTGFSNNDATIIYNNFFLSSNIALKMLANDEEIRNSTVAKMEEILNGYFSDKNYKKNSDPLEIVPTRVDVNIVDGVELDIDAFRKLRNGEYAAAEFILEDGKYICGIETEKMSKSKLNTVNPDDLVAKYGADTFRMYEMFLGPVEQSKPWDTKGIEGVHRFIKKLWRLFFDEQKGKVWNTDAPTSADLKILHKTIKKIEEDTERFSFNTAVSAFMVAVNDLTDANCRKKEILEPLLIMIAPYAPHIAEELYHALQESAEVAYHSVLDAPFPVFNPAFVIESSKEYPISINGKLRTTLMLPLNLEQADAEAKVLENEVVLKWLEGKAPKKIVFVKGKMINVVI